MSISNKNKAVKKITALFLYYLFNIYKNQFISELVLCQTQKIE